MISGTGYILRVKGTNYYPTRSGRNECSFTMGPERIMADSRESVEAALHWLGELQPGGPWLLDLNRVEIVAAPACGCCGAGSFITAKGVRTYDALVMTPAGWRCPKHIGRNPCLIEGCGRTFDATDRPGTTFICGTHWREAPKYMRRRVTKLRKAGEKRHWPPRYIRAHKKAFDLAVRAVKEGRSMDIDEINKMMGWE